MPTIAPPFRASPAPAIDFDDDTVLVDPGYLDTMLAEPPPLDVGPSLEDEIAATPLPEPRDLGGVVLSAEYVRREMVMLRRWRRSRGVPV